MTGWEGPRAPATAERRYDDDQVARILKRATEIQRAEPTAADPTGLTISELAEIAREAGIDPSILRRAALEVERPGATEGIGSKLAGAPIRLQMEEVVAAELPAERFDGIVPLIQRATDFQGTVSAVGRTLTWKSRADSTSSQNVQVTVQDGMTLIRIEERFTGMAGGLFGGVLGGVGGGVGFGLAPLVGMALGSVAAAVIFPVVVAGSTYAAARAVFVAYVRKREARARHLLEELRAYVVSVSGEAEAGRSTLPAGPAPASDEASGS